MIERGVDEHRVGLQRKVDAQSRDRREWGGAAAADAVSAARAGNAGDAGAMPILKVRGRPIAAIAVVDRVGVASFCPKSKLSAAS